ncbi:SH3 domain-containing protein [Thomasclavelia sp.]|uniref:SH3 domain-containing protein n=1 Tax=Thomasclavelia sp. TaxID=3025757 RepID=UPI0025CBFCCD|nr:SH3 domain-containing protein [Thomasclavelia sp.]
MAFISALFIKAGLTDLCPLECSCGNAITKAKEMGIWEENGAITPAVGDLIMYDWDKKDGWPEHVGIVESVNGNEFVVIEGNKNDVVGRRTVTVGSASIRGFVKPMYDGATPNVSDTPQAENNASTTVNYKVKVITPSGVNCRAEPNTSGKKITAYANGTVLNVTKESNGWLYVNDTGWVSGQYCTKVTASSGSNATGKATGTYEVRVDSALVVRSGPGTNYARKSKSQLTKDGQKHSNANGGLLNGTRVTVSEWSGNWAKIPSGWVSGDYLVKV